jgi:DNA-directed RNA polymerase subunit RPC12/RpoP
MARIEKRELVKCIKCHKERRDFIIGTVEDHCPHCGFKEGCCD